MAGTSRIGTCWGRVSRRRGVVVLAGALLLTAPLASADAGSQTLCRGYEKCRAAGYSDAGYQANMHTSYWRMYTGPNCTNYVAYRLIRDGLSPERPPADPGRTNASLNAYLWGVVYASLTNAVPKVGSVAWWGADAGKGRIGHVAYVEKVHRDGSITISEDSSSGNGFAWKKLTPGHGWPQGFIHFGADNPRALPLPAVPDRERPRSVPDRPDFPADKVARGDYGGEWTGGPDWGIDRERFVPSPKPDRVEVVKPRRKTAAKKPAKRVVRERPMPAGGEVAGALGGGGFGGWQQSW
jgi:surface antigen